MKSEGYTPVPGNPWETASGGQAVECRRVIACSISTPVKGTTGKYRIDVQYFDLRGGVSTFELLLNGKVVAQWKADDVLPPAVVDKRIGGQTSTRFTLPSLRMHTGDVLTLRGTPNGEESAAVDYIELTPIRSGD